jgi:exopolysaccharide biosynthesis polyprenyl glycosylphosphotransferase
MLLRPSESMLVKRRLLNYLILFESILLVCLTGIAVEVRHVGEDVALSSNLKEFLLLVAFPIIWLCCLSLFGAWDLTILDNHIDGYRRLLRSSFMTFLTFSSASYLFKIQISRFVILFSLVGGTLLHLILRWIFLRVVEKRLRASESKEKWLVITADGLLSSDVAEFAQREGGDVELKFLKSCSESAEFKKWVDEVTFQVALGKQNKVLLANSQDFKASQIEQLMWAVQQSGAVFIVFHNLGMATSQGKLTYFEGFNWVSIGAAQISESLRVIKRLFDLSMVIPAIILLSPLFMLIALMIKAESRGPLLYTQERIGQNGDLFKFPKFRSMRPGSDAQRLALLGRPDDEMKLRYKNDPRITRVGRILRRYSLDELPQLWCVFIGSMSLVGPRPILPEETPQLGDFHFRRQIAKPGLTGIWQVSGRKDTTWEERMAFDIRYVQEWSIALDLILIARTFKAIIIGRGAY